MTIIIKESEECLECNKPWSCICGNCENKECIEIYKKRITEICFEYQDWSSRISGRKTFEIIPAYCKFLPVNRK